MSWARPEAEPAVYIGVFGKHPGWDDHIDDLGLETDRLVRVRQKIYTEGVAGNIDSGAWERLDEAQRLPGFGHELVWRSPAGLVVGRLWASRDGKGRTRYPMAVVAHVEGVSWSWVESVVMPRLAAVERACVGTESASEVRRVLDEARVDLRTALPVQRQPLDGVASPAELAQFADRAELGPGREGLRRALYEIDRELVAFRPPRGESRKPSSREVSTGAQHLRVPACATTTMGAASVWAGVLASQIDMDADLIVLRPHSRDWVDLIVGEPAAAQLFCVRASETGLALVTSVPYTLDAAFVARSDALVSAWRAGRPRADDEAPTPAPLPGEPSQGPPPKKRSSWFLWGGAGAVILAAGGYFGYQQISKQSPGNEEKLAAATKSDQPPKKNGAVPSTDLDPALKARQEEAKSRLTPEAEEAARLERERKARDEADRRAKEKADADRVAAEARARQIKEDEDRRTREEADRLAKEAADRASREEQARLSREKVESDRKAEEERDRLAKDAEDRRTIEAENARNRRAAAARHATVLMAILDAGCTLSDRTGEGSVASQAALLSTDPRFAGSADVPEVAALAARVARIEQISASNDGAALARLASDTSSGLAESVSAWSRLASGAVQGWPGSAEQIGLGGAALESLRRALAASPDRERAVGVAERVNQQARAVWTSYFERLGDADAPAIDAACAVRDQYGVEAASLRPRERFNVALQALKQSLAGGAADASKSAAAFVDSMRAMDAEFERRADVQAALATLSAAFGPPRGGRAGDPRSLGPGSRGWKGELVEIAGRPGVRFSMPDTGVPHLDFVRIEAGSGAAYLCTIEVSTALFAAAVQGAGAWSDVLPTLRGYRSDGAPDSVRGARTWQFEGPENGPATRIIASKPDGDPGRGWIPIGARTRGTPYYPDPDAVQPPSASCPIQHVSPVGALYVANLLGCRLPSSAEWAAAQEMNSGASANRRDQSWRRVMEYLRSKPDGIQNDILWPDSGQCAPESMSKPSGEETYPTGKHAEAAVTDDDGVMWFNPVEQGAGVFKSLVGNVAEYVQEDSVMPQGAPSVASVRSALGKFETVRMIGASALSAREINPTEPYPIRWTGAGRRGGFSDVGFRLAFSETGGIAGGGAAANDAAEAVRRAVLDLKYLSP